MLREANKNKIFVPKFYHDRASRNILKHLKFVKKHEANLSNKFGEPSTFGRVFYEYHKNNINSRANQILNADDNEFFFRISGTKHSDMQFTDFHLSLKTRQIK